MKGRIGVLNSRKRFKQVILTVVVLILTFSIVLSLPQSIKTSKIQKIATNTLNSNTQKTIARGADDVIWDKTYGGVEDDFAYCVKKTTDGGFIITGFTESFSTGGKDVWLIKTDENGDKEWEKTFGGIEDDVGYWVEIAYDGGYIIVGYTRSYGAGEDDLWLIKTDAFGNEEWNKIFGGLFEWSYERGYYVVQTTDVGYIILGYTGIITSYSIWLIKTDENGTIQCNKTYSLGWTNIGYCIQQTTDGGYIIAGFIKDYDEPRGGHCLIKTDENFNKQWGNMYADWVRFDERGSWVEQTNDGGYILVGGNEPHKSYTESTDVWLIKTNSNGDYEWKKTFGGEGYDNGYFIDNTTDGGYIIIGRTSSYGAGSDDIWLIKTDENGDKEWDKTYGGKSSDKGLCGVQITDKEYIIMGNTESYGAGSTDVWLLKVSIEDNGLVNRVFGDDYVVIFIALGALVLLAALLVKYFNLRMIRKQTEQPKKEEEWEGVFFKDK